MILDAEVFEREGKVFMTKPVLHTVNVRNYASVHTRYAINLAHIGWMERVHTHQMLWWTSAHARLTVDYVANHLSHSGLANMIVTNRCDLTCWYDLLC